MWFVFGVFAWGMVLGLPAVAPALASNFVTGRSGIERVQAEAGTDVPGSRSHRRAKAGHKGAHQPPDVRRNDEDRDDDGGGGGSDVKPSPDAMEPPGCIYRKEPLGLIV
ncbi:hypothetical protein HYPDE_22808 [Hyphomicrobium denitrificans 1NES1]|uniref:Secreted protein n=1 Tax=Hyphomicrobium denitrificans 1NES1 TaxID=670307 RepID=N0B010_9HYPH|nr:hypothetical protein [Hyphomicrobium denitrificans]AGK56248.1 hypothetical protein HYPDE_22808 [Hyphomicrobium denitrificans 1NES1]